MEETAHLSRRKQSAVTFAVLLALTILEVAVSQIGGHHRAVMAALIGLAVVQAVVQILYFMHLRWETRVLRLYVLLPLAFPPLYALVLIADGIWRRLP
jgi:caa(3)-type oxidase subunit IV